MLTNCFAEFAKLCLALVFDTKCKCLLGHLLIEKLHFVIVLEQLQTLLVGFPDELEPWRQVVAISTIL